MRVGVCAGVKLYSDGDNDAIPSERGAIRLAPAHSHISNLLYMRCCTCLPSRVMRCHAAHLSSMQVLESVQKRMIVSDEFPYPKSEPTEDEELVTLLKGLLDALREKSRSEQYCVSGGELKVREGTMEDLHVSMYHHSSARRLYCTASLTWRLF